MVMFKNLVTNLTDVECRLLMSLLSFEFTVEDKKLKRELTVGLLAKNTGNLNTNPLFVKMIHLMIENECIEIIKTIGKAKILKIHKSRIRDYIDEQEEVNHYYVYFNEWHICTW